MSINPGLCYIFRIVFHLILCESSLGFLLSATMSSSKICFLVSIVSLYAYGQDSRPQKCVDAEATCGQYTNCALEAGLTFRVCKKSLAYDYVMNQVTGRMAKRCSWECIYAIGNLTSFPRGKALETCDCGRDAICLTVKSRMQKCREQASGHNNTRQGCTEAREICSNNANCTVLQDEFLLKCNDLISGVACTDECRESQDKFLNSNLGKALSDCECDGIEEPHCRGIRTHYDALCKPRRSTEPGSPATTSRATRYREETSKEQPTNQQPTTNKQQPTNRSKLVVGCWTLICTLLLAAVAGCHR